MKVLGSDIVDFFNSSWPEEYYVDDSVMSVNADKIFIDETDTQMPTTDKYELSKFGYLCGAGNLSLETFYSRWKKNQTTITMVVQVPKENEQEIREMLKRAGITVK